MQKLGEADPDKRLTYEPSQRTVEELRILFDNDKIQLNPSFQRDSVWRERDRRKLIESILRNYPIPAVFLYAHEGDDGETTYDVIDGKQRLESIFRFTGDLRGRYKVKVSLNGTDEEHWLDFNYLKRHKLQNLINNYKVPTIQVSGDVGVITDLFVRINSTGKALTGAEKRKAKYVTSAFLKEANRLADRWEGFLTDNKILSVGQISRMKHVELICELMASAIDEDVINRKKSLDRAMRSQEINARKLKRAVIETAQTLRNVKRMFPKLRETRLRKLSDFYSLAVLIMKYQRERLVLTEKKRNQLAWEILSSFALGVDQVALKQKTLENIQSTEEPYRQYLMTVTGATDDIGKRRSREKILRSLTESIFQTKDRNRTFSAEQRRIIWNAATRRRCAKRRCRQKLTFDNFTIDHVHPWSRGGSTNLSNAALMCRSHNSAKRDHVR